MIITVTANYGELAHEYTPIWDYGEPGRREHGKWSTVYTADLPDDLIVGWYTLTDKIKEPCVLYRGEMLPISAALTERSDEPRITGAKKPLRVLSRNELMW